MGIDVLHVGFAYGTHRVLEDISFHAESGRLTAVLGANGAGKSTLFRGILGLLPKYEGKILLNGREVRTMGSRELARCAAYVPQSTVPVFDFTALQMVLMGTAGQLPLLSSPGKKQENAALAALDSLGIQALAGRGFAELSGGERQLVLLARALVQGASILILDEPTASLDYGNQYLVLEHVRALSRAGYTVLLSTHNPNHALRYADDTLLLREGRVLAQGSVQEVLTSEALTRLYGVPVRIAEMNGEPPCRVCVPGGKYGKE